MNKLMIAIALCAALAACKKEDTAPAADAPATPAADSAAPADAMTPAAPAVDAMAPAADATATVDAAGLPKACEDYLNRAKACFSKSNAAAATAFQQGVDQAKAQWETVADKSALAASCTSANDQFAQTVAMLKCE